MIENDERLVEPAPAPPASGPLTYGEYLRVPELTTLQSPLSSPEAHDELLFIIVQQVQELWFKQQLHELRAIITCLDAGALLEAIRLLGRVNRLLWLLGEEVALLETMPPQEFLRFRGVLSAASGLESQQFREVELASGLGDPTFLKVIGAHMDVPAMQARWPRSLHTAFVDALAPLDPDPVLALMAIYDAPQAHAALYLLAEALSEYEVRFSEWRFHHVKVVERAIGDRSTGTAGSSGGGYLARTLAYRFFPELWEARNRLTARATRHPGQPAPP
jgi:tryptophan 2,3-dioxygenase